MDLRQKLIEAGLSWKQAVKRVGEVLLELERAGEPVQLLIHAVLGEQCGMPQSLAICALRWARGDFGSDEEAQIIMRAPASKVASMPAEAIRECLTGEHRIISREQDRVVNKAMSQMTREEIADNIGPAGFLPVSSNMPRPPQDRKCVANRLVEDDEGQLVAVSKGRETIRMLLPAKIVAKILEHETVKT